MENLWASIFIGISLAMDALSVSISTGAQGKIHPFSRGFIIASVFGVFQWAMTIIGGSSGNIIPDTFLVWGRVIAGLLVLFVGVKMIIEYFKDEEKNTSFSFGWVFITGIATSIDALGIGISFAFLQQPFLIPALIIGIITFIFCFFGYFLGKFLQKIIGKKAEFIGGIILIFIGLNFIISY